MAEKVRRAGLPKLLPWPYGTDMDRPRQEISRATCSRIFTKVSARPLTEGNSVPRAPSAFSFNSSVGACPKCKGFGRIIEVDPKLVIPDENLSLGEGAVKAFSGKVYGHCQKELENACLSNGISLAKAWRELPADEQDFVWNGDGDYVEGNGKWYGIRLSSNGCKKDL